MKTIAQKGGMIARALLLGLGIMLLISAAPQKEIKQDQNSLITICHFGRTIRVDRAAVTWHTAHGDYMGSCIESPQ